MQQLQRVLPVMSVSKVTVLIRGVQLNEGNIADTIFLSGIDLD